MPDVRNQDAPLHFQRTRGDNLKSPEMSRLPRHAGHRAETLPARHATATRRWVYPAAVWPGVAGHMARLSNATEKLFLARPRAVRPQCPPGLLPVIDQWEEVENAGSSYGCAVCKAAYRHEWRPSSTHGFLPRSADSPGVPANGRRCLRRDGTYPPVPYWQLQAS